jgi:hypothetical protein
MKIFSSVVLSMGLALGGLAYGQSPAQRTPPPEKSNDTPKVTFTGCLAKGSAASEYTITDQKTGEKIPFTAPAQIEKYVNQTVKLTGTMVTKGQEKAFQPESINPVSATCQ